MGKAGRSRNQISAAAEESAGFDQTEWMHWHDALACGERLAGSISTAGRELDAKRRSGEVRALARYSAPDGKVEVRKLPGDIEFTAASGMRKAFSAEWTREMRERRGGSYTVWVHRVDVGRLWPSGEQPTALAVGSNPRRAGANPKYDREFLINHAWAYVFERGLPEPASLEGLIGGLRDIHGSSKVPEVSRAKEILGPAWRLIKELHGRR
jgi:hypothetical protein